MFYTAQDLNHTYEEDILLARRITSILTQASLHREEHELDIPYINCHSVTRALIEYLEEPRIRLAEGLVTGIQLNKKGLPKKVRHLPHSWFETVECEYPVIIDVYPNGCISDSVPIYPKGGTYAMFRSNFFYEMDITHRINPETVAEGARLLLKLFRISAI